MCASNLDASALPRTELPPSPIAPSFPPSGSTVPLEPLRLALSSAGLHASWHAIAKQATIVSPSPRCFDIVRINPSYVCRVIARQVGLACGVGRIEDQGRVAMVN